MTTQTIDLRAQVVNVKVMRNDAWSIKVTKTGTNLAGYTITAQVRPDYDSPDEDALDMVITVSDEANGIFYVGQEAATLDGVYDVQIAEPSGLPRTYVKGRITLDPDVTRD